MIEGVSRTSIRGVPTHIIQQEFTTKERINAVKWTKKACVLEVVPSLATCLPVACLIYEMKPVHFFLMCCNNITWLKKTRWTWDKSTSTMRLGRVLQLSINYSYNINMNNVNIYDKLWGSYLPDRCMMKHKWWWSMFFWVHVTLLVNAYV